MLRIKFRISVLVLCLTLVGCNYNVVNKEPIFNNYKPESKEYKNKLAEIIRSNPDDLTYIFERYIHKNGADYLEIRINGEDTSATALVLVKERRKGVDGIIEKKGIAYGGAELYGLKLDVVDNPSGAIFLYKELDFIID